MAAKAEAKSLSLWNHMRGRGCSLVRVCFRPLFGVERKSCSRRWCYPSVCGVWRLFQGSPRSKQVITDADENKYRHHSVHTVTMSMPVQSHAPPCLIFMDVLAYLNKLNLVISFLQIEFLKGLKRAKYE